MLHREEHFPGTRRLWKVHSWIFFLFLLFNIAYRCDISVPNCGMSWFLHHVLRAKLIPLGGIAQLCADGIGWPRGCSWETVGVGLKDNKDHPWAQIKKAAGKGGQNNPVDLTKEQEWHVLSLGTKPLQAGGTTCASGLPDFCWWQRKGDGLGSALGSREHDSYCWHWFLPSPCCSPSSCSSCPTRCPLPFWSWALC